MTNKQTGTVLLSEGKAWIRTDREVLEDRLVALEKFVADLKDCAKGEKPFPPEPESKPAPVDPDLAEAKNLSKVSHYIYDLSLRASAVFAGIKRGRELERAEADIEIDQLQETVMKLTEAKPGMVWVKHDGSAVRPVPVSAWVTTRSMAGQYINYSTQMGTDTYWPAITHYAIIPHPAEEK